MINIHQLSSNFIKNYNPYALFGLADHVFINSSSSLSFQRTKQLPPGSRKNDTRYAARGVKKMNGRRGERETIRSTEHKVKDLETKGPQDYVICIIGDV